MHQEEKGLLDTQDSKIPEDLGHDAMRATDGTEQTTQSGTLRFSTCSPSLSVSFCKGAFAMSLLSASKMLFGVTGNTDTQMQRKANVPESDLPPDAPLLHFHFPALLVRG